MYISHIINSPHVFAHHTPCG